MSVADAEAQAGFLFDEDLAEDYKNGLFKAIACCLKIVSLPPF